LSTKNNPILNLPLFIARKIYGGKTEGKQVSRPAIRIATAGVAIGLAVMLISVSVVLGFKHTIRDKVIGFGSHIQVGSFMTLQTGDFYPIQMDDSMLTVLKTIPGVKHVQRYAMKQGILKTDHDFLGVIFKGIGAEYDTTFLHQNMRQGHIPRFTDNASSNKILISQSIADKLGVKANDKIYSYFIDKNGVRTRRFTIEGVYQTNLSQYDDITCFTDLYTAVKLNGWEDDQTTGAELTVKDFNQLDDVENLVVKKVNRTLDHYGETYSSKTIRELCPQIFSWLDLLDLNVWIILALMIAVAGVTMISGLLIIILERTVMIGILKALGARNKTIRHTFMWFATFIIGKGMLIGNIVGLGLISLQQFTGLVKLNPQTYYVNTVPVEYNIPLFIILNVATLLICLFVLIAPSYLISHIHPAKSMRYE
jgi:putative membrane protein